MSQEKQETSNEDQGTSTEEKPTPEDGWQDSCNLPIGWEIPEGQEKQPLLLEEKQVLNMQQEQTTSQGYPESTKPQPTTWLTVAKPNQPP